MSPSKYYIFYTRNVLPQTNVASLVQVVNSANAAANLGYSTVLAYLHKAMTPFNPQELLHPFSPQIPEAELVQAYNIQNKLKVAPLPRPWPVDRRWGRKWTHSNTIISKYYFPTFIKPAAKIVHTRDWSFAKLAIRSGIPAIFEQHHHEKWKFEPEIVNSPLLPITVTIADTVRDSMIKNGMPPEKVITLHNGCNDFFLFRQPEDAQQWREKLLQNQRQYLVVYSGGLYPFKGIDLLIDVAKTLPQIQFVFAGGDLSHVKGYQTQAQEKQVDNVEFLGFLPQNQLASLLQAADILAHPHLLTQAATFTSPLKFFDYLASGTPIASTEIPPLMEFKSANIISGWCEPDQPVLFAQCLEQVLEKYPRKPEGYSENIEFARQFSWENRISKILAHVPEPMRPPVAV